jgi:transposase
MDLKDEQWTVLAPLIPKPRRRADGRGRPWRDDREVLNGILWVLRTGAPWQDVPDRYPSPATCHRRFQQWVRTGVFRKILLALAEDLRDRGKLDLTECFIDATFVGAKKGAFVWARRSAARVQSSWQLRTAMVFLSPSTWPVLRQLKSDWSSRPSKHASSPSSPNV